MASPLQDLHLPIVGQQLKPIGTVLLPVYQCQCEPGDTLTFVVQLSGGAMQTLPVTCSRCLTTYTVTTMIADKNQIAFGFSTKLPDVAA